MSKDSKVSIVSTHSYTYPGSVEAFRPGLRYPEYEGALSPYENPVYDGVREALHLLGLDREHYGTAAWNPLGDLIAPGMCVLIKPNLVMDRNGNPDGGTDCLYTHPSVVAPVIDYVVKALQGSGQIVVGDAPMQSCDFDRLIAQSGYQAMIEQYRKEGVEIRLADFRGTVSTRKNGIRKEVSREGEVGTVIDLGEESAFAQEDPEKLERMRVTCYDPRLLQSHHQPGKHEYEISKYVLQADVIINMPKPKTHRKAGITISLKNFVGANVHKEFLPHHTMGAPSQGGDEYDRKNLVHNFRSKVHDHINMCEREQKYGRARWYRTLSQVCTLWLMVTKNRYSEGSWYGNRTVCRTIADINKLVYYARRDGTLQETPARNVLIIADMIVSGEKEGPVAPSPKNVGIIAAGINPVCFDEAVATLMGMDIAKIPTLTTIRHIPGKRQLVDQGEFPLIISNDPMLDGKRPRDLPPEVLFHFTPSDGWKGHLEADGSGRK